MKRIISIFIIIAVATLLSVNVFADTESEKARLIKEIEEFKISINGIGLYISDFDIYTIKEYIGSEYAGDISTDMTDKVSKGIADITDVISSASSYTDVNSLKNFKRLTKDDRKKILDIGNEAVEDFGLFIIYNNDDGKLEFTNQSDNTIAFKTDASLVTKQSSITGGVLPMIGIFILTAACAVASAMFFKKIAIAK